jgi:hypothetical protein
MHGSTQERSLGVLDLSLNHISVSAAAPIPVCDSRPEEFHRVEFLSSTRQMVSQSEAMTRN